MTLFQQVGLDDVGKYRVSRASLSNQAKPVSLPELTKSHRHTPPTLPVGSPPPSHRWMVLSSDIEYSSFSGVQATAVTISVCTPLQHFSSSFMVRSCSVDYFCSSRQRGRSETPTRSVRRQARVGAPSGWICKAEA